MESKVTEVARFDAPESLQRQLFALQRNVRRAFTDIYDVLRASIPNVRTLSIASDQSKQVLLPREILLVDASGGAVTLTLKPFNGSWQASVVETTGANSIFLRPVRDAEGPTTKRVPRINGGSAAFAVPSQVLITVLCDGQDFWVGT